MDPPTTQSEITLASVPLADAPNDQFHSDALLQASRRVDWRFLLPDPNLGHVAYLGSARNVLAHTLRLFSASLTVVDGLGAGDERGECYDVVVVCSPSPGALEQAAQLVRPGGFLYVEVYGIFGPGRLRKVLRGEGASRIFARRGVNRPRIRQAANCVAAVERLGFIDIQAYWHWPNFESCTMIVPLGDRAALLHAVGRHVNGRGVQLKATLGSWLLRSGWLAHVVPCFSVVAQHSGPAMPHE
ncbi:MAG: hypothetical protein M3380_04920, partial [Chloroflexota bacterium]|nr:hypothetical protein [Chloroflexota bacterium]